MTISHYVAHTRPLSFFFVGVHFAVGFVFAPGFTFWKFMLGLFIWTVCMNGGTLAINSRFDKDEGNIGLLKNPPPLPKYLLHFSLALLLLGLLLSFALTLPFVLLYSLCFALSVLYSVPPFRLKSKFGYDILVNMVGYGACTFLAGYFAQSATPSIAIFWAAAGFAALFGALYPTTQIYQYDLDKSNNDMTFAVHLGPQKALRAAIVLALVSHIFFFMLSTSALYLLLVGSSLVLWIGLLLRWIHKFDRVKPEPQMYLFLGCWIVTEVVVFLSVFL